MRATRSELILDTFFLHSYGTFKNRNFSKLSDFFDTAYGTEMFFFFLTHNWYPWSAMTHFDGWLNFNTVYLLVLKLFYQNFNQKILFSFKITVLRKSLRPSLIFHLVIEAQSFFRRDLNAYKICFVYYTSSWLKRLGLLTRYPFTLAF